MVEFHIPADFREETLSLLEQNNRQYPDSPVTEVYGQVTQGEFLSSGRMTSLLPEVGLSQLADYVTQCSLHGIQFHYTLNPSCTGNRELYGSTRQNMVHFLQQLYAAGRIIPVEQADFADPVQEPLLRAALESRATLRLNGEEILLSQFMEQADGRLELPRLTVLDLDGDGQMEAVVKEYRRGVEDTELGSLVLDVQHGVVYAYDLTLRAFNELRADGTFIYSSGAADNGIASLKPEEDSSTYQILAESRTDSAGGISYTVDGLTVTGTEYSAALDRQAQKPEAVWYEWNETNLNLLFGSVTARSNGES